MSLRRFASLLVLAALVPACLIPRHDAPAKVRESKVPLAPAFTPLFERSVSPDGTSWSWSTLLGLVGAEAEGEREMQKALPFFWHDVDPPYSENTVVFPLYYARDEPETRTRWYSIFYGTYESPEERQDHVLLSLFRWKRSKEADVWESGLFPIYDREHHDNVDRFTLIPVILPILGTAHVARSEWGFPAEGVTTGAHGRTGSRRFEFLDVFGALSVFGYDDVGDRREVRLLSLFDSELLSLFRSWRARDPADPFVREWLFPLYMSVQDRGGGWGYVGPFWGHGHDAEAGTRTDWWLLGLLMRQREVTEELDSETWRVLGLPVWRD
ncbi:MAG: hypothetical protein DHS20C15_11070 [Planctomycetota bacterium]|nr:MAG: hypothetical protein DHS20C15_11070 [Planctomycetota bacterium]